MLSVFGGGRSQWKTGEHLIEKYAEEKPYGMPLTMGAFLLGAFSTGGYPPTAGIL